MGKRNLISIVCKIIEEDENMKIMIVRNRDSKKIVIEEKLSRSVGIGDDKKMIVKIGIEKMIEMKNRKEDRNEDSEGIVFREGKKIEWERNINSKSEIEIMEDKSSIGKRRMIDKEIRIIVEEILIGIEEGS